MHGHTLRFGDDAEHGLRYLHELNAETAKTYFEQAKVHGATDFEDRHGRKFLLEYHHDDHSYQLIPQ